MSGIRLFEGTAGSDGAGMVPELGGKSGLPVAGGADGFFSFLLDRVQLFIGYSSSFMALLGHEDRPTGSGPCLWLCRWMATCWHGRGQSLAFQGLAGGSELVPSCPA